MFFGGTIEAVMDPSNAPDAPDPATIAGGAGNAVGGERWRLPDPAIPFGISLAMVGIAPRIEVLTRVEEKIRVAAHEMMGLPRGLMSFGVTIADSELTLAQIGEPNIDPHDLDRFKHRIEAVSTVFDPNAVKVQVFEKRLLKLMAYEVWVEDGIWPSSAARKAYRALEEEFSTDLRARLADLDAVASVPIEGMTPADRAAHSKRWEQHMNATNALADEVGALLFIYFEKENPAKGGRQDPIRRSIAEFFKKATAEHTTSRSWIWR